MSDQVAALYAEVIKSVLKEMQPHFQAEGDEQALNELIQLWITRLLNAKTLPADAVELNQLMQSVTSPHAAPQTLSHGMPLTGYQNMMQPAPHMAGLQHRLPHQVPSQPLHSFIPGQQPTASYQDAYQHMQQNRPTSAASLSSLVNTGNPNQHSIARPRPRPGPPPQGYPYMPQTDGANDEDADLSTAKADEELRSQLTEGGVTVEFEIPQKLQKKMKRLPQVDGVGDDDEDEGDDGESEQENEGGNEESLNSSLDSSDGEQDADNNNKVVCLYDKVTRTKAKWRCVLKEGIMNLKDKDYVFQKATGEFDW